MGNQYNLAALVVLLAAGMLPTCARADDPLSVIEFHQLKAVRNDGTIAVGFSAKNLTADLIGTAFVECAALDADGNVVDTGIQTVTNLHANESSYGLVDLTKLIGADHVSFKCRVSQVNP